MNDPHGFSCEDHFFNPVLFFAGHCILKRAGLPTGW
jgi:hypothetical protein